MVCIIDDKEARKLATEISNDLKLYEKHGRKFNKRELWILLYTMLKRSKLNTTET